MSQTKTIAAAYLKESNLILSNKGKTFFWAKFLLSQQHAEKAVRLYRFCRYIDDIGDETTDKVVAKKILEAVIQSLKTGSSDHQVIRDAISLFNACEIDIQIPISLIQGVISDLKLVRFKDEQALLIYCYQVAGTVGLMMSKLLDVKDERAFAHAIDLGIAMQMTNICRDVKEDAMMNRRYLPESLIGKIEPGALVKPNAHNQNKIRKALAKLLDMADQYYLSGYNGLCFLPSRARVGILIAATLYQHIGVILKNKNYACWAFRSVVSKYQKAWLTLKILPSAILDMRLFFYLSSHNPVLHLAIKKLPYAHKK